MKLPQPKLVSRRAYVRLALLAVGMMATCPHPAYSQNADTAKPATSAPAATTVTPYSLFQDSTITSTTNAMYAHFVPAVDANGNVHYWDVSLLFDVSSTGQLTLASGSPQITASVFSYSGNFLAGTYVGPSDIYEGTAIIVVSGPSELPGGGTEWTLAAGPGAYPYTYPDSAMWYVESIASNPLAARIKAAGITSTAWSYGVGNTKNDTWFPNSLLGFSQVGNTITIANFTSLSTDKDQSTPVDQITYTLKP